MKVIGIEHIGIAVKDLEKNASFWKNIIGLKHSGTEDVDNHGVLTDIYDTGSGKIELLVSKYPDSPISKFIKKRGAGIHHICLNVDDIDVAIEHMNRNKIKLIGDKPTIGTKNNKVIFIHPRSTGGILVELAEKIN